MHTARERSTADDVRAFEIADAIQCESALMVNLSVASPLRTVSLWSKSLRMWAAERGRGSVLRQQSERERSLRSRLPEPGRRGVLAGL